MENNKEFIYCASYCEIRFLTEWFKKLYMVIRGTENMWKHGKKLTARFKKGRVLITSSVHENKK